ncbi:MAG: endonuclease III domain-containing protein [Gammaproteobacteria bacterium]|nr:endonuclease III domain-containing protein [Gammaproteobacteria bacterium]
MSGPSTIYKRLFEQYGYQQWWPAERPFEVMVGAILGQNTAWENVEKAITNLKSSNLLTAELIVAGDIAELALQIRPSGYFNIKAQRLSNYCHWFLEQGGIEQLGMLDTVELRERLLSVNGVGPETADDILLYALERPVFVIDAYTRRIFSRLGLIEGDEGYETLRAWFESHYREMSEKKQTQLFNEYHALIVEHAKRHCRKKPACSGCPLSSCCRFRSGME